MTGSPSDAKATPMGDVDITLRHMTRQHAAALAQLVVPEGTVEVLGWLDTQVTALERRLDKALALRVNGERRVLHVEFESALSSTLPCRVYEYQAMLFLGLRVEAPEMLPPPMESLIIVLSGRQEAWSEVGALRTGWPERRWSGVHYQVEAVYQRTVGELRARGSVFWLLFAPLCRDVTVPLLREIVDTLRREVPHEEERAELYTGLLVMADIDPWGYNLREEIAAMLQTSDQDLLRVSRTLRDAFEKGRQEGIEKGIEKGLEKGLEQGMEKLLRRILMRRLGRDLTEREQQALAVRVHSRNPEEVQDQALALEGEALAAWLLNLNA